MTKTEATQQARSEITMYGQGRGWIISKWDPQVRASWLSEERDYYTARAQVAEARHERAAELAD